MGWDGRLHRLLLRWQQPSLCPDAQGLTCCRLGLLIEGVLLTLSPLAAAAQLLRAAVLVQRQLWVMGCVVELGARRGWAG